MKLAVISDVHGNLEAVSRVLAEVEKVRPHAVVSLGDNIGYGPDSQAVMDRLTAYGVKSVLGNHEMAVKNTQALKWFNPVARKALNQAISQLSPAALTAIRSFPRARVLENMRFVHGVPPCSPFLYLFQLSERKLAKKMADLEEQVCFAGHTHDLGLMVWDGENLTRRNLPRGTLELCRDKKYLINAGSVGQPRDGTPDAKYLLMDTRTGELTVRFVPYPFEITQKKIIAAGIPEMYAAKLNMRFPSGQ